MKFTLQIPEALFRRANALAAREGVRFDDLVNEALARRLELASGVVAEPGWTRLFGELRSLRAETRRVMARIEADSERVDDRL